MSAKTYDLGDIAGEWNFNGSELFSAGAPINDRWNFQLSGSGSLLGILSNMAFPGITGSIGSFSAELTGPGVSEDLSKNKLVLGPFQMLGYYSDSFPTGSFTLHVTGTALGNNAQYSLGLLSAATAADPAPAPVPEPETLAMMLLGSSLIGLQMRRKSKSQEVLSLTS